MFDEKAQSGTVFRLMIDAIIGLIILMIILSVLGYFQSLRVDVSKAEFVSTIKAATQTPDGRVVSSQRLVFLKGTTFSSDQLQYVTNYSSDCFEFQTNHSSVEIFASGKMVEFKQDIETILYARCRPGTDDCVIFCDVSFGRKLEEMPLTN
jgi:hypothetical protein